MRTRKFRGKAVTGENHWVFGSLVQSDNKAWIVPTWAGIGGAAVEVDPETVGQFTGMLDGPQNEVCEGDIIGEDGEVLGIVCYDDSRAAFVIESPEGKHVEYLSDFGSGAGDWKIIGNIHEKSTAQ